MSVVRFITVSLHNQDYTVVKKTSSERCQDPVSEGWGRPLSPIMGPPPHPLIHEDINDQKILELTYKMIELLTGEVPIRYQDVAIYFSMEEWEYLEGHKDQYKDIMMDVPQPLTSPGLSSKRTTPERCPRPLLPQDCNQGNSNVPQDHQGEDLTHINTTETYVRGDERCKEEIPTYDYPDDYTKRSEGQLTFCVFKSDDFKITHDTTEMNAIIPDLLSSVHRKDLSSDPLKQILLSDSSESKKNESHSGLESGKNFNQKTDLVKHEIIHSVEKPFFSASGKCLENKSTFVKQKRINARQRPHSCSECGQCFVQKSHLVAHQKSHTGEKSFSCSECGKCYVHKSNLVLHQRTHTGEKPYLCSECGKGFTTKLYLVTHQRTHTGEKPYSCPECGKSFTDKSNFVRHQKIHTRDKPFSCSECGKCFNQKRYLLEHQKSHT
ncbi:uncharacterized protein LOC142312145 [Anomaloglossus baeobatrachus]|uniref:uncharacterized protein LOC142312145 n=1 Tax=Anomaloglossus baeobatrachus TaxID=238106 RepID=UPI003F50BD4D